MKIINAILFLCCASAPSIGWTDEIGTDAAAFELTLHSFFTGCDQMRCQAPYKADLIFGRKQNSISQEGLYQTLTHVATEQAQIWADTILEGDYLAAGDTQLDQVYALYENDILIGYRITYSEQAWALSQCDYYQATALNRKEALLSCAEGRITEASFVSPAFTTFIRDPNQFAEFKERE